MIMVITGASKGIGAYLAELYIRAGRQVIGTYYSTKPKDTLLEYFTNVDISDYDSVQNWICNNESILKDVVLINCAGCSYNSFAHKADIRKWRQVIDVNLYGTFNVIHTLLPIMRKQNYGRIINLSSVVASIPTKGVSAYAASKSALWGLTKTLAAENASKGITVNCINLGYMEIGMGVEQVPDAYKAMLLDRIPSAKFGLPQDIYNTVEYLVRTNYINGAAIDVNGGLL